MTYKRVLFDIVLACCRRVDVVNDIMDVINTYSKRFLAFPWFVGNGLLVEPCWEEVSSQCNLHSISSTLDSFTYSQGVCLSFLAKNKNDMSKNW